MNVPRAHLAQVENMPKSPDVADLLAQFQKAAANAADPDPRENNKWADRVRACYQVLRTSEEGKAGLIALLSDPNPHVRVWAGGYCLQWVPELARSVLEDVRDVDEAGAFEAEWTLIEFDRGTLSFE
jgi:hypothetical protein